jgi:hypothetical protein
MITEKQFLDAIDIIKKYQEQINSIIDNTIIKKELKTDIIEWCKKNNVSQRLYKAIKYNYDFGRLRYVEDIKSRSQLMIMRNIGKRSVDEFFDLINNNI